MIRFAYGGPMTTRRGIVTLLAIAIATTMVAAAAKATIVPQRGMAGLRLGMSFDQVAARLGQPLTREEIPDVDVCCHYTFAGGFATTFFDRQMLGTISTTARGERT